MLTDLHLENFRCHREAHFRGLPGRMAWIGPNGIGKTSLLEAIHVLARLKSFRTHQNRELIAWGADQFGVAGHFHTPAPLHLKVRWSPSERSLEVDGSAVSSVREFWARSMVVILQNSDRQLVTGPAALRRAWMDALAATLDPSVFPLLQDAQFLLRQKNALLRQDMPDRAIWDSLTAQLRPITRRLAETRARLTAQAGPQIENAYHRLGAGQETLTLRHHDAASRALDLTEDELWAWESTRRVSRLGPHRDDWEIEMDGRPLRDFGSEGQQKSALLAMRLAEAEMIHHTRQQWPILLVDDALNELDPARREAFWALLPAEAQIFLTATRTDILPAHSDFVVQKKLTNA